MTFTLNINFHGCNIFIPIEKSYNLMACKPGYENISSGVVIVGLNETFHTLTKVNNKHAIMCCVVEYIRLFCT